MPLIIPSNSISGEFEVANSLRFDDGSSDSLNRTNTSSGSRKVFTFSCWFKKSTLGSSSDDQMIFSSWDGSNGIFIQIDSNDLLQIYSKVGGVVKLNVRSEMVFRDVSAWYHIVVKFDSNNTNLDLYVNGVEISQTVVVAFVDADHEINESGGTHYIGTKPSDRLWDGYMAEVCFIDGTALDPTSFGEFDEDTGIWKPIDVSGLTFGTNGFYLDFENSGSLGADVSGNGNNFTVNNLTAIDQTTDTCTNNFATLNPLDNSQGVSFSLAQGNLELNDIGAGDNDHGLRATMGVLSGKWYYEQKQHETSGTVGLVGSDVRLVFDLENQTTAFHRLLGSNGSGSNIVYWSNGTFVNSSALQGWSAGDIIGVALDMDNGKLFFSINGVFKGFDNNSSDPANGTNANFTDIPTDGTGGFAMPYIGKRGTGSPQASINFGNPSFSISSGNTDGNGYGNFEYAVPSGYYALNTKNLAEYG